MYRSKKDVDKHVENLISKLSVKEFKTRAYSVARLYYEVGDYASCQKYVEQYLTQKDNNAAAYKLLGQALQKLGQKDKALEQYKTSLDIDPSQTTTILDICELLADDELVIEPGRAKFWCEKAEATFPRHPVIFRLRERLVTLSDPNPEALVNLLTAELAIRPKDTLLHVRLLRHYLHTNQYKEAFEHSCNVEFSANNFLNSNTWYEVLCELLNNNSNNINDWLYQLLLLTVRERICVLSLTETPSGISKSLVESNELLHIYDQAIERIAKAGAPPSFGEFHGSLLQHHRGQFAFHAATFLLKKAKKDQLGWRDATKYAAPLMLIAWHTVPLDTKVNWLRHAPEKQLNAVSRWYLEGTYRCSQSGHYLLSNNQDKSQSFLDRISQCCSGTHWRDKLYEKIFTTRSHLAKIQSSHLVSNAFGTPVLRLPRKIEVEAYDGDAQRQHGNSLHHFVWTLLNYKNLAHFKCTLFDMLKPSVSSSGPETLNKLDIHAFLFSAALTSRQQKLNEVSYVHGDKPCVIPANITDLLCPLYQLKWWDCAYKFSQNELGTELTDIRATLSRGIEVVRCIDNHGLDPELLCHLGRIFSEKSKVTTNIDDKNSLEVRSGLYYASAIPLLEKLKNKIIVKLPEKRLFDYTHKEMSSKELNTLIEESKLYVAVKHFNDCEYDKVIETLSNLKSPQAYYHLSQTYKRIAFEDNNSSLDTESRSKYLTLLTKAKNFAYKALDKLKETETNKNKALYSDVQELIEDIETHLNKIDPDLSGNMKNEVDGKYSSDENESNVNDHLHIRTNSRVYRNLSSTPKPSTNQNTTNYRSAIDSHILESTRVDHQFLERIETEIKNLQKRDTTINNFMEQTKDWFDENRKLGNQIISTINSNIQNTTDQFKLLKISVDQVKDQIDECRNECKDVGELKKQVAELKKEVSKLKKASSEPPIDENDLYHLDDDYRTNESTTSFAAQLPFTPPQVIPPFNQRLVPTFPVPPNPYQLYGQNLYNLYNQYSQLAQPPSVPGAAPIFDPTRAQVNYPGVYSTPDQMYLDMPHLVQPNIPSVSTIPVGPTIPTIPSVPVVSLPPPTSTVPSTKFIPKEAKENPRSLPVNVVITSSDPLPTCTTTPAPILSVTIPQKHIKVTPHNYQITMPSTNETKAISPPVFSFPISGNKLNTAGPMTTWNQSSVFKTHSTSEVSNDSALFSSKNAGETPDNSKTVVDGAFSFTSPNTSLNKSRTLSERSNTSVENYDPCPDFKPIVPLPAEVKVTTGEENESVIFSSRAKLFRFISKQWKERGLGEIKLLKHNVTGKVRVLMRREQVHKICANHIICADMEIKPMKNETKAYFWVANDYADEVVVLEKFCIRFKTADIAQQFFETFEKARVESAETPTAPKYESDSNTSKTISDSQLCTPVKDKSVPPILTTNKAVIGGFTFSSTPTFKTLPDETKSDSKPTESTVSKSNVFSGLTFKTNTNSPFSNLFNVTPQVTDLSSVANNQEIPNKLNTSDTVEEFEPNVDFKPVVPLPALVDQKTGEEDENILFEHRAKLLRFDVSTKEWKERGLGCIKLLVQKDNIDKLRLLMRREQIMKICCNHAITKDMVFQKMPNMDKAVTWCAKDFSEGELVAETFCLRFKTVELCDGFINAVETARSKMNNDSKATKEAKNAAKQNTNVGFGDKFKIKGAWSCETCYTNNLENFDKCACCEQPKPQSEQPKPQSEQLQGATSKWGDAFKPKPGSWECKQCFVRNEANMESCNACDSPKDPSKVKPVSKNTSDSPQQFKFGIVAQKSTEPPKAIIPTLTPTSGWGDKFKPKEGTWECQQCFVRNEASKELCSACNNPKDPNTVKKDTQPIFGSGGGQKFNFGIPATLQSEQKPKTDTSSIFDGTGAHKFSFGIPTAPSIANFGDPKAAPASIFGAPNSSTENEKPLNFSKNTDDDIKTVTPVKTALLPTPQADSSNASLGGKTGTFDFVFKPKTPTKGKSPIKSPNGHEEEDSDGNEDVSEDDGVHIHFSPVVPMPDKVEVVTGEENETELYGHRAKLFRFISGEWKERGIGVVKILKHKETEKLRVVMRREQVLKICLNHALTNEIIYTAKDDKTWLFVANDFSEGEISLQSFCLRFKCKEIAKNFKDAIDEARGIKSDSVVTKELSGNTNDYNDNDDVVFVDEIQATAEEKQKAKDLMLPENFFTYKNKESCRGCRGCKDDDDLKTDNTAIASVAPLVCKSNANLSTPIKTAVSSFQSPTSSVYGTPASLDKTADTSIFRTPLTSMGSNTKSTNLNNVINNDGTNKNNTFASKPTLFSGFSDQKTNTQSPVNKPETIFGAGDTPGLAITKSTLAPSKLTNIKPSSEIQNSEPKSVFGSTQAKSIFGETKSVFGDTSSICSSKNTEPGNNKPAFDFNKGENKKFEFKSIFSTGDQKPGNVFTGVSQGSLFGSGAVTNQSKPSIFGSSVFGSSATQNQPLTTSTNPSQATEEKSVLANAASFWSHAFKIPENQNKSYFATTNEPSNQITEEVKTAPEPVKKEPLLTVDNDLSFAALSSGTGPGFTVQKKPDFKWEGAGQQLFTAAQRTPNAGDKSNNESGAGDETGGGGTEEDFDPHFEPIVPLPDKIVVTTGEEDEEKLFGERCKLYRYDDKAREWKERGVGEMKILFHPHRNTYRLLLRREQVHKAVLNMLLFADLELLPMKNSDRAWTWAGRNYAEIPAGEQEMLAVRFKSIDLATSFHDKTIECVRKLQAAAAKAVRDEKKAGETFESAAPLRLPKHLEDSARVDNAMSAKFVTQTPVDQSQDANTENKPNGELNKPSTADLFKQVLFQDPEEQQQHGDEEDEDYEHDYNHGDYEGYYNEDEEDSGAYYTCDGEAVVRQGEIETTCPHAHIQVLFDQDIYAPKILVTDSITGEILADMLIHTDTEFQMSGDSCSWSGTDFTGNLPVPKSVNVNFYDTDSTIQFYDACETSKGATYTSTDPET